MARKLTRDDLWSLQTMGDVALSPDGRSVAFAMYSDDRETDQTRCALYLLHLDEHGYAQGSPRQLTGGLKQDSKPIWMPDSRYLLFLSNRNGDANQIWVIDTTGGEAFRLTSMLHGVDELVCSPDGQWIAFTAFASPGDDLDVLVGRKPLDENVGKQYGEDEKYRLRTVNTVWYRSDGRGLSEKYLQVFVMPAPTQASAAVDLTAIRRLTSLPIDHTQPSWTPDSQEVGLLCNINKNRERSFTCDLWVINRETIEARCLTQGNLEIRSYSWSPNGQSVMIVGVEDRPGSLHRLYLVTRNGNIGDRMLAVSPDFTKDAFFVGGGEFGFPGPYHPQWSQNSQQVYFLVTEQGRSVIYRLDVVWRSITQVTTQASSSAFFALLPQEQALIVAQEQTDHPWELYRVPLTERGSVDAVETTRLTHLYDSWLSQFVWGNVERITYRGVEDAEIDGWLISPIGAREGVRYPLLVTIHGGPHWAFGGGMDPMLHYFAAQGYAVFYCNPHGSTGYGEAFMQSLLGDWGGRDYQDILLGVDECIARGIADPERLALMGYSYGGYMTMFIVGHTPCFKAAVALAGISNLTSFVLTSDISFRQIAAARGAPWEAGRSAYYVERSPLSAVSEVTTPTLLVHPENDLRCPIEQSEQFYMALKLLGKAPVEFVRIPSAWHGGVAKPSQVLAYWERVLTWFRKYIQVRPKEYEQEAISHSSPDK